MPKVERYKRISERRGAAVLRQREKQLMTKIRFQTMPARKRWTSLRSEQPSFGGTVQNSKENPSKNQNSFDNTL